jgi:brefeldin A-resistance guanine nucleotide exchange factor 1
MGGMKCLFRDDHPSEQTRKERRERDTILAGHVDAAPQSLSNITEALNATHLLRNIKSKKRLMRKAARLFNTKSSKGIEFLVKSGIVAEPITPRSVASFLRNGIVVGLNKKEVGAYLGEVGKSPQAGKSPPNWERDWFHKEVLATYCSLFRFERQSLLDGLRMFLASFRLPGEAQQIDRILQAFSDSCGQCCDESATGSSKIFSDDPKRASDAAYLLSFSIIMLNTD